MICIFFRPANSLVRLSRTAFLNCADCIFVMETAKSANGSAHRSLNGSSECWSLATRLDFWFSNCLLFFVMLLKEDTLTFSILVCTSFVLPKSTFHIRLPGWCPLSPMVTKSISSRSDPQTAIFSIPIVGVPAFIRSLTKILDIRVSLYWDWVGTYFNFHVLHLTAP